MKKSFLYICLLLLPFLTRSQINIYTSDIDNYWIAYDSIQKTQDFNKKLDIINRLYINKGSKGLKQFMWARRYNDTLFVKLIDGYPKFWNSIRANTLAMKGKAEEIKAAADKFKILYPQLKPADIYFTIGGFRSGGTIKDNMIMIGAEIAAGTPDIDLSEFQHNWLANVFKQQTPEHIISLCIHEYVHTMQRGSNGNVLSASIKEGSCDFITEMVLGRTLSVSYLNYGRTNESEIKELFKKEMFAEDYDRWIYNARYFGERGDMGYFMGYAISKAYYNQSKDKTKAIRDIIRLKFGNDSAVESFLERSGYFGGDVDKKKIIAEYYANLPYIVSMEPFRDGSKDVDSGIAEWKITFSKPMDPENYSIYYTDKGKDYFPFEKVGTTENDNRTFVFKTNMFAGKTYEFIVSNEEFSTPDGFKIRDKSFKVRFRTKDFEWDRIFTK